MGDPRQPSVGISRCHGNRASAYLIVMATGRIVEANGQPVTLFFMSEMSKIYQLGNGGD
jgi:hypothetical protein